MSGTLPVDGLETYRKLIDVHKAQLRKLALEGEDTVTKINRLKKELSEAEKELSGIHNGIQTVKMQLQSATGVVRQMEDAEREEMRRIEDLRQAELRELEDKQLARG